jgi:hypothetical protein
MYGQMLLEDGASGRLIDEGASSRIYEYALMPTQYIVKKQKRQARSHTHPPNWQQKIQQWSNQITQPPNFQLLRVPAAFEISTSTRATAYVMERIDTSQPELLQDQQQVPQQLLKELLLYYFLCSQQGYFPNDYELYKQPDGKYMLVDFDKFGIFITKEKIEFPFHQIIHIRQAQQYSPPALQEATMEDLPDEQQIQQPAHPAPQPPPSPTLLAMRPQQDKPPKSPNLRSHQYAPDSPYGFALDPQPFSL